MLVALAGCSPRQASNRDSAIAVVAGDAAAPLPRLTASAPASAPKTTTPPVIGETPVMLVHKTFTDPPLPPELRDAAGIPPPHPSDAGATAMMRPTVASVASNNLEEDRP
jgi:hypothetical protein